MKKFLLAIGLFSALSTQAQNNDRVTGSIFAFQVEYVDFQRGQLLTYLDSKGLAQGNMPDALLGFNLNSKFGQSMIGIDYSTRKNEQTESMYRVTNKLTTFAINYGYSVIKHDNIDLYPFAGFRLMNYAYRYQGYTGLTADFEGYLTQNQAFVEMENRMYGLDLGIGFSYTGTLSFTLKGGTQLPFVAKNWRDTYTEDKINNGPDLKSMFYVKASIGFGEVSKDSKVYRPSGDGDDIDFPWND